MMGQTKNQQFFEHHEQDIYRWVSGSGVRALLLFESTFRVSPDYASWIHDGMMSWFETTQADLHAQRELNAFQCAFLKGIPNLNDSTQGDEAQWSSHIGRAGASGIGR